MTKILAFSGRKQSGKSTGASHVHELICNKTNLTSKIYSFADPLKQDICMNILGLTYDQCYGSDDDKNSLTELSWEYIPAYDINYANRYSGKMTAREVMEVIGTNIFRKIKSDVWVKATLSSIQRDNLDIAIIADCRFPNEADAILDTEGLVIRVTKDPFKSTADAEIALDKDNYDWQKFSIVLDNSYINISEKNALIEQFLNTIGIL
jgi:hypothetical protein